MSITIKPTLDQASCSEAVVFAHRYPYMHRLKYINYDHNQMKAYSYN